MWSRRINLAQSPTRVSVNGAAARDGDVPRTAAPATTSAPLQPKPAAPPAAPAPPAPDLRPLIEALAQSIADLDEQRRQSLGELQQAAIELSVAIASRLVNRVIDAGEFGVRELVEEAVQRLPASGPIQVRLQPADLQQLQRLLATESPQLLAGREVRFTPDTSLARGCCRAELPEEGILSDLHLSLGDLHEELMEGLADAQVERRRTQAADRSLRRFPDRRETA
jgi:hypothetical protein